MIHPPDIKLASIERESMKPFVISLLLIIIIQFFSLNNTKPHPDIVVTTCEKCAASSPNVNLTLCLASFDSAPKSHCSDLRGLGVIATKISVASAINIKSKVKDLIKNVNNTNSTVVGCLNDCLDLYSDSIPSLRDSAKAIKADRYDDANIWISAVLDVPGTCEDGFNELGTDSPLTEENAEFFAHTAIALAVTAMLQGLLHS